MRATKCGGFPLMAHFLCLWSEVKKLTHDAIWNEALGPSNRYVLWHRGELWDVRYHQNENGSYEWIKVAAKPFENEAEAWQAAFVHWEKQPAYKQLLAKNQKCFFNE